MCVGSDENRPFAYASPALGATKDSAVRPLVVEQELEFNGGGIHPSSMWNQSRCVKAGAAEMGGRGHRSWRANPPLPEKIISPTLEAATRTNGFATVDFRLEFGLIFYYRNFA